MPVSRMQLASSCACSNVLSGTDFPSPQSIADVATFIIHAAATSDVTGAVNLELLQKADPQLHAATVRQIQEFGQSPQQMFKQPHPHRLPLQQAELVWPLASQVQYILHQ
jgi:hypothetical protein